MNFLSRTNLASHIQNGYVSLLPKTEAFTASIAGSDLATRNSQMSTALEEIHIFKIFHSFFTNRATDYTNTVSDALASSFASWTILLIVYVVIFLVVFFLVKIILSPLWKDGSLFGEKGKSFLGRLFGCIRMVFKATMCILFVMAVLSLVSSLMAKFDNPKLLDWINSDLNISDSNSFSIGKMFYNTASYFFEWISLKQ